MIGGLKTKLTLSGREGKILSPGLAQRMNYKNSY